MDALRFFPGQFFPGQPGRRIRSDQELAFGGFGGPT
jgi:hypothetical protein